MFFEKAGIQMPKLNHPLEKLAKTITYKLCVYPYNRKISIMADHCIVKGIREFWAWQQSKSGDKRCKVTWKPSNNSKKYWKKKEC